MFAGYALLPADCAFAVRHCPSKALRICTAPSDPTAGVYLPRNISVNAPASEGRERKRERQKTDGHSEAQRGTH